MSFNFMAVVTIFMCVYVEFKGCKSGILHRLKKFLNKTLYLFMYTCAQSCLTFCGSMDYSPPGSCVHGIFQARIVE